MKSWDGLDAVVAPVKPRRTEVRWRALSATFVTLVILAGLDAIFPNVKYWDISVYWRSPEPPSPWSFKWSQITATEHLVFHKCFSGHECAKLSLPLDYFDGEYQNETVSIAIVKQPARVAVDHPRYGGPILINPGGPGGSGSALAIGLGSALQTIVDPSVTDCLSADAKYFDIIGFDPRGIGATEPAAWCIPDEPSAWSWSLRETEEGILGSSDAALGRLWSMTHAFGSSCKEAVADEEGPDIKQYMSTASVARDMLEIAEKHAEYVAKEVARLSAPKSGKRVGSYSTNYTPGEAKVQYWGFSYGTYLGSTFASMFPDRVGRLVLDGVVSWYDYNHSLGNGSLTDTEKALSLFYVFCSQVGPEDCALATANSTIEDIEKRFHSIIQSLYHNPLPIISPEGPEILTYTDIKLLLFSAVYQPRLGFPLVADLLYAVEQGGGAILNDLAQSYRYTHVYSCAADGSGSQSALGDSVPTIAILCGDGVDQSHTSIDEFVEYWKLLDSISPAFGSIWSILKMHCTAWKMKARHTFEGPFGGNTSHPILFVSNTADPVTPLRSGRLMHSLFPGSGLLVGDNAGHCSISMPLACTLLHVRAYFQTGVLPPIDTVCVPPPGPFSLNSTDPKSPFYDPSLGAANVVARRYEEFNAEYLELDRVAWKIQEAVAVTGALGLPAVLGGEKMRHVIRQAAYNLGTTRSYGMQDDAMENDE